MIIPVPRVFGSVLALLVQVAAIAFWLYIGTASIAGLLELPRPLPAPSIVLCVIFTGTFWGIAAGVVYGIYWRYQDHKQNKQLMDWLRANGDKIREGATPMFYRSRRVRWESELVCYHLVFSFIVFSSRTKTRWIIKGQEPNKGLTLAACLYTFCYGWWGFPGVIWTPMALVKNLEHSTTTRVRDILEPPPPKPKPQGLGEIMSHSFEHSAKQLFSLD